MTLVAGVDSSTQSVKIVVCDLETGSVVRTARASHPDATEVPASAWLAAYREATADPGLLDGVSALAVGGQQHGMVTLDEDGELVRDALLWNDNRSAVDARRSDCRARRRHRMGRRSRLGPGCLDDCVQDQMAGSSRAGECRQNCRSHPPSRLVELADRRSQLLPDHRSRRCIGHVLLRRDRQPISKRSCTTCLGT